MRDPAVRMVDFARFVMGGEEAIGLKRGDFLEAYETNRKEVNQAALDSSTVAQVLKQFLENRKDWKGTAGELLGLLTPIVSDAVRRSREWPKSPRGLSGAVRRLVPNLRRVGITIDVDFREGGTGRRLIEIKRTSVGPSQPSPSSQENPTVTEEASENEPDTRGRDGCDGCDGREAAPESVTVDGKGDTEWEA
jgi:bifunctional DNA-binding transcriptional regulator/antitoxin component of YhaV-PrlF toxin-antitoxin module